jgi:hypothetical protein
MFSSWCRSHLSQSGQVSKCFPMHLDGPSLGRLLLIAGGDVEKSRLQDESFISALISNPVRRLRMACWFFLHCLIASMAPLALSSGLIHSSGWPTVTTVAKHDGVDALFAFGIGWFVYSRKQHDMMKWVWVGGLIWFGLRAIPFTFQNSSVLFADADHSVYWEMAGSGCVAGDRQGCSDWIVYFLPLWRTMFYSLGAYFCSWRIRIRGRHDLPPK